MTFQEFIRKYEGKGIDYDGAFQNQCVDLYRQYIKEVLLFPQPAKVIGAKDFWYNYETDPALKNNYIRIANTPEAVPQEGDVMLWDKWTGNVFGHVAIVITADVNKFTSFDQNWKNIQKCLSTAHNYTVPKVLGWLRPKSKNVANFDEDINTDTEIYYNLKSYQWYDNHWGVIDIIHYTDTLYKENDKLVKEVAGCKFQADKQAKLYVKEIEALKQGNAESLQFLQSQLSIIQGERDVCQNELKECKASCEADRSFIQKLKELFSFR